MELFLIPVVNIQFYLSWFLPILLCLHSSVLCKHPVTSLYLADVSPNFPIFFCIRCLMLDLTNYIQIHTPLCQVCLSIPTNSLPTCTRDSFHADKGPRGSAAKYISVKRVQLVQKLYFIFTYINICVQESICKRKTKFCTIKVFDIAN